MKKVFTIAILLMLLFSNAAVSLSLGGTASVEASAGSPNLILGLFRFMAALEQRNRVYAEARATTAEINAYYDQLIAKNDQLRTEMVRKAIAGEVHPRFVRSYTRLGAALKAEHSAALAMIEAEKQQARQDFLRRLGREIRGILLGSPGGQKILTEIREAIGGIREAAVAVQVAAEAGKPTQMLGEALAKKVGGMGIVKDAARELGSQAGHQIDRGLGGLVSRIEGVIDNINTEVNVVITWLDDMDDALAQQQVQTREPVSLVGNRSTSASLIPLDRETAAVDIAANAFARAAEQSGNLPPGVTRATMIDRIKADLLDARLAGIETVVSGTLSGRVYCTGVGRGEYELAAKSLGQIPEVSQNPEQARYIVCYDLQTSAPQSARLFGSVAAEKADLDEPRPEGVPSGEIALPVGTYIGTANYFNLAQNDRIQSITTEVTITITEDGTLSGFQTAHAIEYPWENYEGCSGHWENWITVTYNGNLVANSGSVDGVVTYTSKNFTTCTDVNPGGSLEFDLTIDINIVDDQLTGSSRLSPDNDVFAFTITAQKK